MKVNQTQYKYIDKQATIDRFKNEHDRLKELVISLPEEQVLSQKVLGDWTIKDIIAHLAAWNWEAIDEVDRVLQNEATWPARYEGKLGEDEFNRKEVEKRKGKPWDEVINEWDDSFWTQIKRMEKITPEEWRHQSGNQMWSDGTPVAVYSLFAYEYGGQGHEGGHAKQIKEFLR